MTLWYAQGQWTLHIIRKKQRIEKKLQKLQILQSSGGCGVAVGLSIYHEMGRLQLFQRNSIAFAIGWAILNCFYVFGQQQRESVNVSRQFFFSSLINI